MSFWRPLGEGSVVQELPPLTPEVTTACEKKFGIKFPPSLLELLKGKNGGFLENRDFKLGTESYVVNEILGIGTGDGFREIRPCSTFMNSDDELAQEATEHLREQAGDLDRLFIFADSDYCWYGLDYNKLNSAGEPTIVWVLADADEPELRRVADSVSKFLQGQYAGDAEPIVHLDEAQKYSRIAQGGFSGTLDSTGRNVCVEWTLCSDAGHLVAFQKEDWGFGETRERFELSPEAIDWEPIPLEDYGFDIDPELAKCIRPTIEAECLEIELYEGTKPACYQLSFQLPPGTQHRIQKKRSEAFQGRWKNSSDDAISASLYCGDKGTLEKICALIGGTPKKRGGISWFRKLFR